jgi:hypothetical protein
MIREYRDVVDGWFRAMTSYMVDKSKEIMEYRDYFSRLGLNDITFGQFREI